MMAKKLAFERYVWFIDRARREKYPNARKLAEHHAFEISVAQAQRDIDFMRDFLHAPLKYDYLNKGYVLEDSGFNLPLVWIENEELMLFALSKELMKDPDSKKILSKLMKKISPFSDIDIRRIADLVSYKGMGYYHLNPGILGAIIQALADTRKIRITYLDVYEPEKEAFEITVCPVHLLFYGVNWYLIGQYGRGLRIYAVSRIDRVEILDETFTCRIESNALQRKIQQNFGIFISHPGEKVHTIELQFKKSFARFAQTIIFHPGQRMKENPDGTVTISFKSTLNPELIGEILRYGENVTVLKPERLIDKMRKIISIVKEKY